MEYQILRYKSNGELEPCGTLYVNNQSFDFVTECSDLSGQLEKIKQQGYVPHFHNAALKVSDMVRPGEGEFIRALEENLGNYRFRKIR
jgi:hypothetical protein